MWAFPNVTHLKGSSEEEEASAASCLFGPTLSAESCCSMIFEVATTSF